MSKSGIENVTAIYAGSSRLRATQTSVAVILTAAIQQPRPTTKGNKSNAQQLEEMLMATKQKPVHEIRMGRIRAAIWANQTDSGEIWFNVTVSRLYNDGNRWHDTSTFRRDDLPLVSRVVNMAYVWIWDQDGSAFVIPAVD